MGRDRDLNHDVVIQTTLVASRSMSREADAHHDVVTEIVMLY